MACFSLLLIGIATLYLYQRIFIFGFGLTQDEYHFSFSILQLFHIIGWYTRWSFGAAESLLDYMNTPWSVLDRYFVDYPQFGSLMLVALVFTLSLSLLAFFLMIIKLWSQKRQLSIVLIKMIIGFAWFVC